ncbi:MAG: hypothetical protein A2293_14395 [Elusimicrobia bacterium RIFOXYB2_FULL_49_7]|nr:MAG: hypothetical protein A2293_14395 [Elusimicrobia bacterium RIFOXYB2_FULL_49_7]
MSFTRIVTHNDFDGIASGALCSAIHEVEEVAYTGPNTVTRQGFPVTEKDIVCDLPYPGECGLWFDHHAGNAEELKRRGKDLSAIPGRFAPEKSCARVIFEFYRDDYEFPEFYEETVREVDKHDSFGFESLEDWRRECPSRIINCSLKARFETKKAEEDYYTRLLFRMAESPLPDIAEENEVRTLYQQYLELEKKMLEMIAKSARFHARDTKHDYVIIDLTDLHRPFQVERNLAQLIYPNIRGVFLLQHLFESGVKTNNFMLSGSLTLKGEGKSSKDIGEIMRSLNIGDGHPGAGSGQIFCVTKPEFERKRNDLLDKVHAIWEGQ